MMTGMQDYIYGIICACLICGIYLGFAPGNGASSVYARLLVGMVMVMVFIAPLQTFQIQDIAGWMEAYEQEASMAANFGQAAAKTQREEIITEQTRAYILDKATSLGLDISVEISLDEEMGCPWEVRLEGAASPYAKGRLGNIIAQELAVPEERQIWIG